MFLTKILFLRKLLSLVVKKKKRFTKKSIYFLEWKFYSKLNF